MKIVDKKIGANGSALVELTTAGLHIQVKDVEAISDQEVDVTFKVEPAIDWVVKKVGAPGWLVTGAVFVKAQLQVLAAKP